MGLRRFDADLKQGGQVRQMIFNAEHGAGEGVQPQTALGGSARTEFANAGRRLQLQQQFDGIAGKLSFVLACVADGKANGAEY